MEIKSRFDHFNINVTDLAKSLEFYGKALGLKETSRKEAADGSFVLAYLGDGQTGFRLELTWLRDHTGAYAVLETIRTALSGQAIRGARFYPAREQFEDVANGVWTYLAVYAADVPWVSQAQFPDDVAAALAAAKLTFTGGLDGDAPITVGG